MRRGSCRLTLQRLLALCVGKAEAALGAGSCHAPPFLFLETPAHHLYSAVPLHSNVLFNEEGRVCLADLGLAKVSCLLAKCCRAA